MLAEPWHLRGYGDGLTAPWNQVVILLISKAGGSVMDAQTAGRVGLDELDQIIERLYGRLLIQRARLRLNSDSRSGREDDERIIKNIQTALQKMRALRGAMMVGKPATSYLSGIQF